MYLSFTVLGFSGVILVPPISRNPSTPRKKKKIALVWSWTTSKYVGVKSTNSLLKKDLKLKKKNLYNNCGLKINNLYMNNKGRSWMAGFFFFNYK